MADRVRLRDRDLSLLPHAGGAARITVKRDGHATVAVAAHEMGMGTATTQTIVLAGGIGLPLDHVSVEYGDSILPGLVLAGGSQQTASMERRHGSPAKLNTELLKLAGNDSPLAGLRADDVEGADGGVRKRGEPERHESYESILARAQRDEVIVEAEGSTPLELVHWSMHSYGAMFCEVQVNAVTGEIRVSRFLGSFDCGRILNPKTAAASSGAASSWGSAGADGRDAIRRAQRTHHESEPRGLSCASTHGCPRDRCDVDRHSRSATPLGARGIGEIGITGVGAAVANAVFNATGNRIRDLPITLDKLM